MREPASAADGTEGPGPQDPDPGPDNPPSKIVQCAKSVLAFCYANWLIFAFGFAALMGYLFPRE